MDELRGKFLIAETDLQDPNFFRTVVLVIQHNQEGAFGLVVNRQSEVCVGEVIDGVEGTPAADLPVFVGGPVQQNYVFVLHTEIPPRYRSEHCEEVCPDVYFEPSFRHVLDYLKSEDYQLPAEGDPPKVRVFAGYSGWAEQQLENELMEEAWVVNDATADLVFPRHSEEGWKQALSAKGDFYRVVAETGFKPSMN